MKHVVIILVALVMLVKPLWPVADYVINYDYIKNELCENKDKPSLNCDGKCYLAKMLAEESGESKENPFRDKSSKSEQIDLLFFEYGSLLNPEFNFSEIKLPAKNYSHRFFELLLIKDISHPPENLV